MAEELTRMRFHTERFPEGDGTLVLADDGRFHVEVSEAMLERIAARETEIVERSARVSQAAAAGFVALGIASLAAGWLAGRLGGRLRERWTSPRAVGAASVEYDPARGMSIAFADGYLYRATLAWTHGEFNAGEAERFYDEARRLQRREAS